MDGPRRPNDRTLFSHGPPTNRSRGSNILECDGRHPGHPRSGGIVVGFGEDVTQRPGVSNYVAVDLREYITGRPRIVDHVTVECDDRIAGLAAFATRIAVDPSHDLARFSGVSDLVAEDPRQFVTERA
jgi:hypothetical protein